MSLMNILWGDAPTGSTLETTLAPINLNKTRVTAILQQHIHHHHHHHYHHPEEDDETTKEEIKPHDHSIHFKSDVPKSDSVQPQKYNHTYLDHLDEMPQELQDFINEHYNWKFVMESIAPENDWNSNSTINGTTSQYANMPKWKRILDKVVTYIMTFNVLGIMLGMGCAIYWRDVVNNLWPPVGILIGMVGQFIILPATGFGFSILFRLQPYEALGCLVVSCSPGGSFSNFFTYWVEGDLALSIVMTACSSIIAFVGMPFNLWLYSSYYVGDRSSDIVIPYLSIFRALAFICGPVIVGMVIRHFSQRVARIITRITSTVAYFFFMVVLISWLVLYWQVFLSATPLIYANAVILPMTGFCGAYLVALILRRSHKVCRTIGIETGSQNMPVALSIILLSFQEPEIRAKMILFPTLYGIFMLCEVLIGIVLYRSVVSCMRKKDDSNEYPLVYSARVENGSSREKDKLQA